MCYLVTSKMRYSISSALLLCLTAETDAPYPLSLRFQPLQRCGMADQARTKQRGMGHRRLIAFIQHWISSYCNQNS